MTKKKKNRLRLRAEHFAVTSEGVVLQGEAAAGFVNLLIRRNTTMLSVFQDMDRQFGVEDLSVDADGRLIVKSARIQKLIFEALRVGSGPANPRELGKLIARTGGRFGTFRLGGLRSGLNDDDSDARAGFDSEEPTIRGEAHIDEVNILCGGDNGLDIVCGECDITCEGDETDVNIGCGWGS